MMVDSIPQTKFAQFFVTELSLANDGANPGTVLIDGAPPDLVPLAAEGAVFMTVAGSWQVIRRFMWQHRLCATFNPPQQTRVGTYIEIRSPTISESRQASPPKAAPQLPSVSRHTCTAKLSYKC
jgi:hypothetical protein